MNGIHPSVCPKPARTPCRRFGTRPQRCGLRRPESARDAGCLRLDRPGEAAPPSAFPVEALDRFQDLTAKIVPR